MDRDEERRQLTETASELGSAKSTYVSILLPSWYLANHPANSILAATHNVEFAERWGRRVRNAIAEDSKVLGIALADDNKAASRWALETGACSRKSSGKKLRAASFRFLP
jgi:hypothetical protein